MNENLNKSENDKNSNIEKTSTYNPINDLGCLAIIIFIIVFIIFL